MLNHPKRAVASAGLPSKFLKLRLYMSRICAICDKDYIPGNKYKRRGMIKRKGGAGSKIVGKSLRRFYPNLQRVKINQDGTVRTRYVCTTCIKSGKVMKA